MQKSKFLISLDLDGTLLKSNKKICIDTKRYIKNLAKQGYFIILNSGRPYRGLINYYKELGLNTPVVCYNGSLIIDPNNDTNYKSHRYPFKKDIIKKIIRSLPQEKIKCIMCENPDKVWLSNDVCFKFLYHNEEEYGKDIKFIYGNVADNIDEDVYTCIFELEYFDDQVKSEFIHSCDNIDGYSLRFWASGKFCEIYHENISKLSAINQLAEDFNVPKDNIFTFGDSDNDIEMVTSFKHGVAMKNSSKELLDVAKNITEFDNNHNGIMKYLKKYLD